MQDGGLPHAGCLCAHCTAVRQADLPPHYVTSMGVVAEPTDPQTTDTAVYLLDATPDIAHQLHHLAPWLGRQSQQPHRLRQPAAIFLTHAHMGHINGLAQLSKEAMNVQNLPLYAAPHLLQLLAENQLWRPLVTQLDLRPLLPQQPITLGEQLTLTPHLVPHRNEWGTGTFAFELRGANGSLLYLPDIDSWAEWAEAEGVLSQVDVAVVDGSFYSRAELGTGRHTAVPHATIPETIRFWHNHNLPSQLVLTHFNHTNPVLDPMSEAHTAVVKSGATIGQPGLRWSL